MTASRIPWWQFVALMGGAVTLPTVLPAILPEPPPTEIQAALQSSVDSLGLRVLELSWRIAEATETHPDNRPQLEFLENLVKAVPAAVEVPPCPPFQVPPCPSPPDLSGPLEKIARRLDVLENRVASFAAGPDTLHLTVERAGGRFVLRALDAGRVSWEVR